MAREIKKWVTICKRTEEPKLSDFKARLDLANIKHRNNGRSFHAPILQVLQADEDRALELLTVKIGGRIYDDIPDDDPMFQNGVTV